MGSFFQQIFELLTTSAGTLVYHLVLIFTIVGAFLVHFLSPPTRHREQALKNRVSLGLGWLLALQILMLVLLVLDWRGFLNSNFLLPPLDRFVILLSLVCILWMWCFPLPEKKVDLTLSVLVVILLVAAVIGFLWWKTQYPALAYNSSWTDFLAQLVAIVLILVGVAALTRLKPSEWIMGVIMLLILASGHVLHLLLPFSSEHFSGVVRATQITAYPFLYILALRRQELAGLIGNGRWIEIEVKKKLPQSARDEVGFWSSFAEVLEKDDYDKGWRKATVTLTSLFGADICLFLKSYPNSQDVHIVCGYDQHARQNIGSHKFEEKQLPKISSALRDEKQFAFLGKTEYPDFETLMSILNIKAGGSYLLTPFATPKQQTNSAILLGTPFSRKDWSDDEKSLVASVVKILVQYFSQVKEIAIMNDEFSRAKGSLPSDRSSLMRPEVESPVSNELRLALQEISALRASLMEYEAGKGQEKYSPETETSSLEKTNLLASISQELRQPLLSINESTNILLSEQDGPLAEKQKKYIERIRQSVERVNFLVNHMVHTSSVVSQVEKFSIHEIDLPAMMRKVKEENYAELKQKSISMHMEFPKPYLPVFSDKLALSTILDHVIRTSIRITPTNGALSVVVRMEHVEGSPDYVLIQIDSSGQLSAPAGESQQYSLEGYSLKDDGPIEVEENSFLKVRSLVEALGGRIWMDLDPEKGTNFSFYMPVIQSSTDKEKDLAEKI